jgi:hypothetical protein
MNIWSKKHASNCHTLYIPRSMHLSTSSCAVNIKKILHLYVGHFLYFKLNVSIQGVA